MTAPLYILREQNVAARRVGDELMIMSAHDSSLFSLNETAAILWDAADGMTPLAEIVRRLILPVFDIEPAIALEDARSLALGLAERGILQLGDSPLVPRGDPV